MNCIVILLLYIYIVYYSPLNLLDNNNNNNICLKSNIQTSSVDCAPQNILDYKQLLLLL